MPKYDTFFSRSKHNSNKLHWHGEGRAWWVPDALSTLFCHFLEMFQILLWRREKKGRWEGAQVRGTRAVGTRRVPGLSCSRQPRARGWGAAPRDFQPPLQEPPLLVGATSADPPWSSHTHVCSSPTAHTHAQTYKHKTSHCYSTKNPGAQETKF